MWHRSRVPANAFYLWDFPQFQHSAAPFLHRRTGTFRPPCITCRKGEECLMYSRWYVWWPLCFKQIPCLGMTTKKNLKLRIKSSVTLEITRVHFLSFIVSLKNNTPTPECGPTQWCRTKENSIICADEIPSRIFFCNTILLPPLISLFPFVLLQ